MRFYCTGVGCHLGLSRDDSEHVTSWQTTGTLLKHEISLFIPSYGCQAGFFLKAAIQGFAILELAKEERHC